MANLRYILVPRCTHKLHILRHPKRMFPKGFRAPTTAALKIIYVSKGTPGEKKCILLAQSSTVRMAPTLFP